MSDNAGNGGPAGVPGGPDAGAAPGGRDPGAVPGEPGAAVAPGGLDAATLLGDVRRLRRQARSARHAYWLPLILFGLLICGSAPFYVQPAAAVRAATVPGAVIVPGTSGGAAAGPLLPGFGGLMRAGWQGYLAYYWLAAIAAGVALTFWWYRRHGRQAGLVTPARGFLVTSAVISLLALILPAVGVLPGDLVVRGTLPFLIIAAGLWMLARAERSVALTATAAVYTAIAVLANLYNIENVLFRLGWNPSRGQWQLASLPNVLLPALVLLAAGAGAFLSQRRRRSPA